MKNFLLKIFRPIGHFFRAIWRWIINTAWVQPLLIVGIIFGVIFSINPVVSFFSNLFKEDNEITLYRDREIEYTELQEKIENGEDFIVIFFRDDCSGCESILPSVNNFYKDNSSLKQNFFTIDTHNEDFVDDTEAYGDILDDIAVSYNEYTDPKYKLDSSDYPSTFSTPTIAKYVDGLVNDVRLGIESSDTNGSIYVQFSEFVKGTAA